jgi:hypothetical protein
MKGKDIMKYFNKASIFIVFKSTTSKINWNNVKLSQILRKLYENPKLCCTSKPCNLINLNLDPNQYQLESSQFTTTENRAEQSSEISPRHSSWSSNEQDSSMFSLLD